MRRVWLAGAKRGRRQEIDRFGIVGRDAGRKYRRKEQDRDDNKANHPQGLLNYKVPDSPPVCPAKRVVRSDRLSRSGKVFADSRRGVGHHCLCHLITRYI
jgi:hypothetical protein